MKKIVNNSQVFELAQPIELTFNASKIKVTLTHCCKGMFGIINFGVINYNAGDGKPHYRNIINIYDGNAASCLQSEVTKCKAAFEAAKPVETSIPSWVR